MPWWGWFLTGVGCTTVGGYLWLAWYFKDVYH